jgi:hypothetical protein
MQCITFDFALRNILLNLNYRTATHSTESEARRPMSKWIHVVTMTPTCQRRGNLSYKLDAHCQLFYELVLVVRFKEFEL